MSVALVLQYICNHH